MKKLLFCLIAAMSLQATALAQEIYNISVKNEDGQSVSLSQFKGKVMLIVNTATRCGFTPQYKELQALYDQYGKDGLVVLDFPCNQFGQQAPGSIEEIHQFCTANFDIKFPLFDKIDVNGPNESALFAYLKSQRGFEGFDLNDKKGQMMHNMLLKRDADYAAKADIKWNFTKFLVGRDGRVLKRYEPTASMSDVEKDIAEALRP
ncbi:MAG: glutathione peroxidase [Prevotella sp.]|nr:glutathione peroxidase [Prevotella sp.]